MSSNKLLEASRRFPRPIPPTPVEEWGVTMVVNFALDLLRGDCHIGADQLGEGLTQILTEQPLLRKVIGAWALETAQQDYEAPVDGIVGRAVDQATDTLMAYQRSHQLVTRLRREAQAV